MLELRNVSTHYGKIQALHDVSVEIKEGEIVTLIGANGAGKSNSRKATACLIFSRTMALKRSAKTRCLLGVFRTVSSVLSAPTRPAVA